MSMWRIPKVGHGVDDRVLHRRRRPDRARLADALGAQLVERGGRLHRHAFEGRQLGGRDDAVVGEVGGQRVALGVVDEALQQGLRRPLRQTAMHLAVGQQRVEDHAGVVDGHQSEEADGARLGVDLHHRHMGAEREGDHQASRICQTVRQGL